jgi:hypothetical protein
MDWKKPVVVIVLIGHATLMLIAIVWWVINLGTLPVPEQVRIGHAQSCGLSKLKVETRVDQGAFVVLKNAGV